MRGAGYFGIEFVEASEIDCFFANYMDKPVLIVTLNISRYCVSKRPIALVLNPNIPTSPFAVPKALGFTSS